jgi:hypothetical protein
MVLQVVGHLHASLTPSTGTQHFVIQNVPVHKLGGGENSGRRNGLTGLPHFNVARVDRISHLILSLSCL